MVASSGLPVFLASSIAASRCLIASCALLSSSVKRFCATRAAAKASRCFLGQLAVSTSGSSGFFSSAAGFSTSSDGRSSKGVFSFAGSSGFFSSAAGFSTFGADCSLICCSICCSSDVGATGAGSPGRAARAAENADTFISPCGASDGATGTGAGCAGVLIG